MTARNQTPPFQRTALALALRQVLQERRWQALLAAGLVGLAPASLGDPFPANLPLSSLDGTNGFKLSGVAAYDYSGHSVNNAGDVNGDGLDDLLIGAYSADPNGYGSGASYVVFGGAGVGGTGTLELSSLDGANGFKLSGVAAYDFSGWSVSAAGDVNGDGTDDLLIGAYRAAPNGYGSGASYVVFGGSGVGGTGTLELSSLDGANGFKLSGVAAYDFSGWSVSAAGDFNGDGVDDLLIGAPYASPNGAYSGASYVVFGGAGVGGTGTLELSSLDGTNGFKLSGEAGDVSGFSVSGAGDVNGDGTDDILIGALEADPNGTYSGASYVVFGGSGVGGTGTFDLAMLDGTNGFKLSGAAAYDFSGFSVSGARDVNGDGVDDILIGAPSADPNGSYSGASYVVFGGSGVGGAGTLELSSLDGSNGFKLSGVAANDHSGVSVSGAADVNDDGVDDILIGRAPSAQSGASYVVFGGSGIGGTGTFELSSLDGTNGFKLSGVAAFDASGFSVSGAGDVNGDGVDDVLIGAFRADPNGSGSGASYVVFGQGAPTCHGLPATIVGTEAGETITGTSEPDVINGLGGHDRIFGLGDDDVICGGSGNDFLVGGPGADTLDGGTNFDICLGGSGSDSATNCEVVRNIP